MIRTHYYTSTGEFQSDLNPEALDVALKVNGGCLWVDIQYGSGERSDVEAFLKEHFKFHPLALDDALHEAHLSRVDDWNTYLYAVVHGLHLQNGCQIELRELDLFLGSRYLLSLHEQPIAALERVWSFQGKNAETRLARGPDHLLYQVLDSLIADYMPVVDGLDDEIDEIEREIYESPLKSTVNRIFKLRRTLLRLRRLLGYLRETLNRLARDDFSMINEAEKVYFRDAYDHVVRLFDITEGLRDMAGGAMESFMSVTSNRINEVMCTLTVVTVLFMPLGVLAGFFGMNFFGDQFNVGNRIDARIWFGLCLVLMVLTPPAMLYWIERKGWLRSTLTEKDVAELTKEK